MGILFSCFGWGAAADEEEEVPNRAYNQLGRGANTPKDNEGSMNHQQNGHPPEPESELESGPTSEPESSLASEPEPSLASESKASPGSEPEPRPESEPESKPESKPEPRPESEPEPKPIFESNRLITHKTNLHEDSISSIDEECAICLEGYTSENPRIITKCLHHFHLGCIYDWQERSGLCPSCLKVMEFQEMN